jgi:hypothetical protein
MITDYILTLLPFIIFIGVFYMIFKWVTKFISLRQEQNQLLKEIIKRLDDK